MIKVVIVDDYPVIIEGIKKLIDSSKDMELAGTALCATDCKKMLECISPNVVLLDVNLPDINGVDLCKYIREKYPTIYIIAFAELKELFYIQKMMQDGAHGCLVKNASPSDILEGIRTVASGKPLLDKKVAGLISLYENSKSILTARERDILYLIMEGHTNKEIAERLFLGVETVNSYRKNLLLKLGVKNTAAMVKLAIAEKLV